MTFENSMKKTNTFLDKTIHITAGCNVHLHGLRNKMVPLLKPCILVNLNKALNFTITPINRIMTLETIVSRIKSITTTSLT